MDLADRRVLVVGAAHGIGAAVASELARRGARVACADHDRGAATAVAADLRADGGDAVALDVDATSTSQVTAGFRELDERFGGLDACVYAAGVTSTVPAVALAFEEWRRVMAVNLDGAFLVAQAAATRLIVSGGGTILFVGSQLARAAVAGKSHYIASKSALEGLTRALAIELAPDDVRVVCLAPGPTRSGMLLERLGDDRKAHAEALAEIPLRRLAEPEEIARTAAFLIGDDAAFVTGTTIVVDGGYQAR